MATQNSQTPQDKAEKAKPTAAGKDATKQVKRASVKDGINPKGGA